MTPYKLPITLLLMFLCLSAAAQKARPDLAEKVNWPSMLCAGTPTYVCNRLDAQGYLFATPGAKKVVIISHGSQGIDSRMYDYVDSLQKEGFAALVIDHWKPRGIGVTHDDYAAAGARGGNELNMASDSLTAADWLRAKGYEKVGSFDAPYRRHRNMFGPHYAKCDILVDASGVTELNSGEKMPGEVNINPMLKKCVSKIYHSGWWRDRFVAVPHWIGFFKQNL